MTLAILLFFLGVILIVLEVFFPSFGVLTLSAAATLIASIVLAFGESTTTGILFVIVTLIVVPLVLWFALRQLPNTRIGRHLVSRGPVPTAQNSARVTLEIEPGAAGVATSELRPSGTMEIDGARFDVVTDGEFIERGTPVHVVRIEGNRILVERAGPRDETTTKKKPRWA